MSFCEHCAGQRFDRARVLRALRQLQRELRREDRSTLDEALHLVLRSIKVLDIPHLEVVDEGESLVH